MKKTNAMTHPASRFLSLVVVLALSFASSARAEDATALGFLQERHKVVREILKQKATTPEQNQKRNQGLDKEIQALLNFEELSKRSLDQHWAGLQEAQRKEFVDLLRQLIQRNYQKNLESTLEFSIKYEAEQPTKDGVLVKTRARSKTNRRAPEVSIDYTLSGSAGSWKVFDVITDGVSLVENYRSQFNRIIRRDGWSSLIDRMRKSLSTEDGVL
jgi:phospholipid transport system substrate-binding protein